jgi:chromosome segregation ATPase
MPAKRRMRSISTHVRLAPASHTVFTSLELTVIYVVTKLADRTAERAKQTRAATQEAQAEPEPATSTKPLRPNTPKGKQPTAETSSPSSLAQIRAELAATQKTRGDLETKLSATTAELAAYKQTDAEQKKRIALLENSKAQLERRMKDRADELKGKGRFVEDVQDEMVALTLQLNMAEQETDKLRKENKDLTERWVKRMEEEARRMNDQMGWEDKRRK